MKLLGFLTRETIIAELDASSREDVVRELVDAVIAAGGIAARDKGAVVESVLERERQGSTGIGGGIALPHAKDSPHVKETVGAFGRSRAGVGFGAVDGSPVHLFFLMVAPQRSQEYKTLLTRLAKLSRDDHFVRFLRDAKDAEDIVGVIEEMAAEPG